MNKRTWLSLCAGLVLAGEVAAGQGDPRQHAQFLFHGLFVAFLLWLAFQAVVYHL